MTGPGCSKTKSGQYRKHTPIVSEAQRRLFGAVASGKKTKATGLSRTEAVRHLKEVKGKELKARKGIRRMARR
jgi:hypothetical protein